MACAHWESAAVTHPEEGGSKEMSIKPSLWFMHRKSAFPCTESQVAHSGHRGQRRNCSTAPSGVLCCTLGSVTLQGRVASPAQVWAHKTSAGPGSCPCISRRHPWKVKTQNKQAQRHICKAWRRLSLLTPIRLGTRTRRYSLCCPDLDNSAQKVHLWQF